MEDKHIDRRVVKTKRAICNAFMSLLSTKNINEITITDIANEADVNRKTVYNYYNGIHEILGEIEDKLMNNLESILKDLDIRQCLDDPSKIFLPITEIISENLDFYGRLLNISLNSQLTYKIKSYLEERVKKLFRSQNLFDPTKIDLVSIYIVTGLISAYQYWFNSGRSIPMEEFSKDVHALVYTGVKSLINK